MKNWEAQAKTNSILASSLKSLEARVDDLATLMEWRAAVDGRFDEIAETFLSMEDHIEELRNDLDENSVELKLQMEKVGKKAKAGIFGSMFMSRMSFKSRPGEGGGDADGDVGGSLRSVVMSGSQEYGARDGGSGSQRHPQRKREGAKSYVKRNWLKLSIWTLLVLQFVIAARSLLAVIRIKGARRRVLPPSPVTGRAAPNTWPPCPVCIARTPAPATRHRPAAAAEPRSSGLEPPPAGL